MITIRANQARGLNIHTHGKYQDLPQLYISLFDPPPHQSVVVVKVSNVRQQGLIIDIVVIRAPTVVRTSLYSAFLPGLRLQALFCLLSGISDGGNLLFLPIPRNILDTRDLPWAGFHMIGNLKIRLATLTVFSL